MSTETYKPFVAVTMDFEAGQDRRGTPLTRFTTPGAYLEALERAQARPILLPHPHQASPTPSCLPPWIDGLLITGGDFDIPPDLYGQPAHPKLGRICRERSVFELTLCAAAAARQLPILGICGGMQVLQVWGGGALIQDVSLIAQAMEHQQTQDKRQPAHSISIAPGSLLEQLVGTDPLPVNSTHHQVVGQPPPRFRISGQAPDQVIEAIETLSNPFCLGVQWHPEVMAQADHTLAARHQAIYDGFVHACRQRPQPLNPP